MNSTYKLVFSAVLNAWVAVAEHVRGRGKQGTVRLLSAAAVLAGGAATALAQAGPPAVNQLPTGAQVAAGTVNISQSQTAASMAISQSTPKAIVNWQTFNVGANAKVNITQPSSTSVLLNRVQSSNPSQIFGQINANGQVFLTNPNGVYFAPGSSVDVGSFTATTHGISDTDFLSGNYSFSRNGATGSILNQGSITAGLGGYIALLAPEVRNQGVVVAQLGGTVALAAGEGYQLQLNSNGQLTNVLVTPATIQTLVDNGSAVQAPGGLIILSAQAANGLLGGVVKNSGAISATGLVSEGGTIRLSASHKIELAQSSSISADAAASSAAKGGRIEIITDLGNASGVTQVDGSISAKGGEQGGDGGFVDTSAARLAIGASTLVSTGASKGNAGTWLLDPYDVIIEGPSGSASGTAYASSFTAGATSTILASSISASLNAGSNVTISTGTTTNNQVGSITVNGPISWSTAQTLTLSANYNININAAITASAATGAGVVLEYNQGNAGGVYGFGLSSSGFAGSINFGGNANTFSTTNYTASTTNYQVITSLGATTSTTAGELYGINGGLGLNYALGSNINAGGALTPLATSASPFTGKIDGLGHSITATGLLSCAQGCGFLNYASSPTIQNLGLNLGSSSSTSSRLGALIGSLDGGTISNVFSSSNVTGGAATGGLIGWLTAGTLKLSNSYTTGSVGTTSGAAKWVGGLIGASSGTAYIHNSYTTGAVSSSSATDVGGLVGFMAGGVISNSYATGSVSSSVANASTTSVGTGGLIGTTSASSTVINSYSTGNVSAPNGSNVGGVVGFNPGKVINTYASGSVSGASNKGGVVGKNTGTVTGSYWNTTTSGLSDGIGAGTLTGATGLTSSAMQQQASFTSFDFSQLPIWAMGTTGNLNPVLSGVLGNIYLGASGGTWSSASNWSLGATPVNTNGGITAVINSGITVNYDTGTAGSLARSIYNAGTISFSGSTSVSLEGTISGTGALVNASSGVVTLTGSNTFSGGSTLTSGTLTAASANALGTGSVSIGAAGKLDLTYSGTVALGSTLSMSSGASITNSANTSSLSVAGVSTLAGSINTAGNQTYTGAVTLAGNTTLTTLNTSQANTNGTITFGAAVDGTASGAQSLTVTSGNGAVSFGSTVGGTAPLSSLTITSGATSTGQTTTLGGNVTTSGNQIFGGNLILSTNTSLTSTANSGNGAVTIAGNINSLSTISSGILKFLGSGYWGISTSSGSTWAYYLAGSNGSNTHQSTVSLGNVNYTSTLSALSSLPTISYGSGAYAWTPALSTTISFLLVGGGGSGGESVYVGGGGGGGGGGVIFANSYTASNQVAITVGAGGAAINNANGYIGNSGQSSTFGSLTALGGGGGGIFWNSGITGGALVGGSGGGGMGTNVSNGINLGAAAGGSTSVGTYYANAGGNGLVDGLYFAGGGGGAGSAGGNATSTRSGAGGSGYASNITGTTAYYGAGGGGSAGNTTDTSTIGLGGSGVGGNGSVGASATTLLATSGVTNTGSGGGGSVNGGIGGSAANKPSGAGGSGIVVLNGNIVNAPNSYSLNINSGTGKASIGGSVANVSTLTINSDSSLSEIAGAISGSTALTKSGTGGVLTLSANNTYSGGTTISAGTLQVGAGGTSGAIAGNIVNNATLAFNRSDDLSFTDVISGTGALSKLGVGALTLSGTNSYSGATTISAGTLKAASGAALGTGAVSVGSSGVLDLTYSGTVALGSTLSMSSGAAITNSANTSNLSVAGASTLSGNINTAGNQTYTGAVTLGGNTTLTTLNTSQANTNGSITFGAAVDGTASGAQSLTVTSGNGAVSFGSAVGGTAPLSSLTITGGSTSTGQTTTLGGNVTTSGNQSFGGNLTLGANTSLTSTANSGNGAVTINGSVSTNSIQSTGTVQFLVGGNYRVSTDNGSTWNSYTATSSSSGGSSLNITYSGVSSGIAATANSSGAAGVSTYIFNANSATSYNYLLLGGGGGGGTYAGGGGGAGGILSGAITLSTSDYYITVGNGGAGGSPTTISNGQNGGSSGISGAMVSLSALGGGAGGAADKAFIGGSGGGAGCINTCPFPGANGTIGQGSNGGAASNSGAGANGASGAIAGVSGGGGGLSWGAKAGDGGSGSTHLIPGTSNSVLIGGGGGGGTYTGAPGVGGAGGGGAGAASASNATSASANTGGGGGGTWIGLGGAGGSGFAVINGVISNVAYAYSLTINSGTGATQITGSVSNLSTLAINSKSTTSLVTGAIGGSTALTKSGAGGVLTLSGANTYTGGTTISAGTLQVGAGSTSGSMVGNVLNNATLAFNRSDSLNFAGAISGSGAVTVAGAGTLTLSGTNTYSGGTTVTAGTVKAASGAALGTGAVTLGSSAVLDLTYSGTVALGSTLSMASGSAITNSANTSNLSVAGASTLMGAINTAGNQTYTGAVTLGAATTLSTLNASSANTNAAVAFGGAVDGAYALTITNGSGNVTFGSTVGATTPLASLTVTGGASATAQTTTLGGNVTTSGNQSYGGNLTLGANAALTSTANGGNGELTVVGNVNTTSYVSGGIVKFLGNGNWQFSSTGGSTWAYYANSGSGNSYLAGSSTTSAAPSSLPFTITYSGSSYSFTPAASAVSDVLVVAGGGAGAISSAFTSVAGGGGGGVVYMPSATLTGAYSITVGSGATSYYQTRGGNSSLSLASNPSGVAITAYGGGGAGGSGQSSGLSGGSGGGGHYLTTPDFGAATQGAVLGFTGYTLYGNQGGSSNLVRSAGGGGGGASQAGFAATGTNTIDGVGGNGGQGVALSISGTSVVYGSGGGGAGASSGGLGGTNAGNSLQSGGPVNGVANTGGGGGAGQTSGGGQGGSGVVIVSSTAFGGTVFNAYSLTVRSGTGKASIGGSVSNISALTMESTSPSSAILGAIGGSTALVKSGLGGVLTLSGVNTYTGTTTVSGGTLAITNAAGLGSTSSGTTVASGATLDLGGVAVGAEAITLNGATLSASTGSSSLAGAVTLGADSSISGAGAITVSGAISSAGYGLALLGAGAKTLSSTTNMLSSIASGAGIGALSVVNNQALSIGQVSFGGSTYSGIASTDTVAVSTRTGDLTVSQNISTSSASANTAAPALKLGAGSISAAGTATGGNLVLSGSPTLTVGAAGIAAFYSGNGSSSTGLSLVNALSSKPSSAVQYNKGASDLPSAVAGYYALFRESPTAVYLLPEAGQSSTYGTAASSLNYCYSSSASVCSAVSITGVPGSVQSMSLGGSAVTASISVPSGVSGSLLLSGPAAVASGFSASTHAGTYALRLVPNLALTGYVFSAGNAVDFTVARKAVTITNTARSTTYDGLNTYAALANGASYTVSGLVGLDAIRSVTQTPTGNGIVASNVANAGNFTVAPSAAVLSTGSAGNYTFSYTGATHTVDKAQLKVEVNQDARFVGQTEGTSYNGVNYSGFVANQAPSVLGGNLQITRSNSDNRAGTYLGVLNASGLSSDNYAISYKPGNYTILPADQLLVRMANASTTYGSSPSYTASSVSYMSSSGGTVVDLTARANVSGTAFTLNDGAGGMTAFTLGALSPVLSSSGDLAAGSYQLGATAITNTSANYSNTVTVVGSLNVGKKSLSASVTSGLSKTYDGTVNMINPGYSLSGPLTGDRLAVISGKGEYGGAGAGTGLGYSVTGLSLGGSDAGNYQLASASVTGNNGVITPAALRVVANNDSRSYDAMAYSGGAGVSYSGFVAGEGSGDLGGMLTYSGDSQGAVNAGSYTITPGGLSSSNYAISYGNGTLTISPANVSVSATTVALAGTVGKVYDGSSTATLEPSNYVLTGFMGSDSATITQTNGSYDTPDAGAGKLVSVTLANADYAANGVTNLANYVLPTAVSGYVGVISPRPVTVSNASRTTTYDGVTSYASLANGATASASTSASAPSGTGLVGADVLASVTQTPTGHAGSALGVAQAGSFGVSPSAAVLSTGNPANYNFIYVDSSHTVNKANATVTANSGTVTYNGANQTVSGFSASGLVGGETEGVLAGVSASRTAKNAGTYTVTPSGSDGNYNLSFVDGALVINKANATVTANSAAVTYNGANQTVSGFTASGLVGGETEAVLSGVSASRTEKNAGSYTVVASGSDGNYNLSFVDGALVINKANATVTANSAAVTYNGANQSVSGFTTSGLVAGETEAVLAGVSAPGATGKNAGSYTTTAIGSDGNYNLSFVDGALVINKANATVTANSGTLTYNGANQTVSGFSASGLVGGENESVLAGVSALRTAKNAGTYTVTASGTDGNYNLSFVDGSLVINKANAAVTANSATVTYNGANQSVSGVTASGLVGGETASVLTGVSASRTAKNAGNYAVVASGTDANYNLSFVDGALVINKANATVTANSGARTYNGANQSVNGFSATGLVGGETQAVLAGVSAPGATGKNAGTYTTSATGTDGNYNLSFVDGALVINKANATVTANSGTRTYNGTNQTVSGFGASGLVGGETESVLTGVSASRTAKNAGSYAVVASGTDVNYNLSFVDGALVINKANATVTANSGTRTYNGANQTVSGFMASGLVGGETTEVLAGVSAPGATGKNAGSYTTTASGSDSNYNLSFVDGALVINKANATVTANSGTLTYSGGNQTVSGFTASGLVGGETASVLAGVNASRIAKNAGSYATTASGTDGNYTLSFVDGSMVINPAPLVITAVTNTKSFDGNTSAQAVPMVSGLKGSDAVANLSQAYADANPGNGKTLLVQETYRIEDGRSGANYAVTLEPDRSGVIRSLPVAVLPPTPAAPSTTGVAQPAIAVASSAAGAASGGSSGSGASGSSGSASAGSSAGVSVNTINQATQQVPGLVAVLVPGGTATAGTGLVIALPEAIVAPAKDAPLAVTVSLPDSKPLPSWIRYDASTQSLITDAVPAGAFPIAVMITVGSQSTVVQISESTSGR